MSPPAGVEREHPLARFTTVRTGGPAEFFARAGSEERLRELVAWAADEQIEVGVVGSGSNLLVADEGVRGLVLKLDDDLAQIEPDGTRLRCGGGGRLPSAPAPRRARRAGGGGRPRGAGRGGGGGGGAPRPGVGGHPPRRGGGGGEEDPPRRGGGAGRGARGGRGRRARGKDRKTPSDPPSPV